MEKQPKLEIGQKIKSFRKALGMTQEQLAPAVGLKRQGNLAAWETGKSVPEGRFIGKLVELAGQRGLHEYRDFFLSLIGMSGADGLREVRVLKDAAAAGTPRQIDEREIAYKVMVPKELCPHQNDVVCVPIKGDSMVPLLHEGYIAAVDTEESDPRALLKQMVMARDPEGGVTVKWLRKVNRSLALVPQNTSPRHEIREIEEPENWKLFRVIWWLGFPSKR